MLRSIAAVIALLLVAPIAAAQNQSDDDLARSHFMAGESYFQQGRYERAAEQFLEAFELSHRSVLLINIATSYERALRFDDAIATLERHQRDFPNSEQARTVANRIESLQGLRDRQRGNEDETGTENAREESGVSSSPTQPRHGSAPADGPGPLLWTGVGLGGLAVVCAAVAIGTGVVSDGTYSDLQTRCPGGACSAADFERVAEGAMLAEASTAFSFIGGGVGAAALTFVLLDLAGIGRSNTSADNSIQLQVGVASLRLTGTFQ